MTLFSVLLLGGVWLGLLLLEHLIPLRIRVASFTRRLALNLVFSASAWGVAALTVQPAIRLGIQWGDARHFGLLHWLPSPLIVQYLIGFFGLDLTFYFWHRMNHKIPFLWRFHIIHHIDPDLDVSTGFRFHFGEVALSTFFRFGQVFLLGVPFPIFASYEIAFQLATFFHHSNLKLPGNLDGLLSWGMVTPKFHETHHSDFPQEIHSNYSVLFSLWDRLFRSYSPPRPSTQITIGVPKSERPVPNDFLSLVSAPFLRHK